MSRTVLLWSTHRIASAAQTARPLIGSILLFIAGYSDGIGASDVSSSASVPQSVGQFPISYEIRYIDKEIADEHSPLGYWEVKKRYPVFSSTDNASVAEMLNERINALVQRYSCNGNGEESFSVDNVFIDERLFSMRYEAMWMCGSMPSPDSAAGTLNIDLADGRDIVLRDQFRNEGMYKKFIHEAVTLMRVKLDEARSENGADCAAIASVGGFYIQTDGIVIESPRLSHGDSLCEVEVHFDKEAIVELLKPSSILH